MSADRRAARRVGRMLPALLSDARLPPFIRRLAPRRAHAAAMAGVLAVAGAFTALTWTGAPALQSDSAEHLLVARALARDGRFDVGGMHGTKYPPAVSLLGAAFQKAGIPPALGLLAANHAWIALAAVLACAIALRDLGAWPALACGAFVAANPTLRGSGHLAVADTLFLPLCILALHDACRADRPSCRSVARAALLVTAATLTRTIGLVLAAPYAAAWLAEPGPWRRRAGALMRTAVVAVVPLALYAAYASWQAAAGPHPTGYAGDFALANPLDAAAGALSPRGLAMRLVSGARVYGNEACAALVFPAFRAFPAYAVAGLLLGLACAGPRRQAAAMLSFLAAYSAVMVLWPYHGRRFGIPLLAVAQAGVAALTRAVGRSQTPVPRIALALLLSASVADSAQYARRAAVAHATWQTALNRQLADAGAWLMRETRADQPIASFDYREIALAADRRAVPLPYTSDAACLAELLREREAAWLVTSDAISAERGRHARALVQTLAARARPVYSNEAFTVYALSPGAGTTPAK